MASLAACQPADSFTTISFAGATLVRSNIGGQGGRCVTPGLCAENETASTPHEIFIRDVGQFMGQSIGLRITNETEYRAWRETINGVKREEEGDSVGYFGVVNLLGPRSPQQRPYDRFWHEAFTYAQLAFEFVEGVSNTPLTLPRTFVSFFDFDTGSSDNAVEVVA